MKRVFATETYDNNPYVKKDVELWMDESSIDGNIEFIQLSGDNGTFTETEMTKILDDSKYLILVNGGKLFTLSNRDESLVYRTYVNVDVDVDSSSAVGTAIYIQTNTEDVNYGTWTKEAFDFN